jgi:hypothetical protein
MEELLRVERPTQPPRMFGCNKWRRALLARIRQVEMALYFDSDPPHSPSVMGLLILPLIVNPSDP